MTLADCYKKRIIFKLALLVQLIQDMALGHSALGTFLDIEGAFDNVSFKAIFRCNQQLTCRQIHRWMDYQHGQVSSVVTSQ